jgi:hypothetical protein
MSASATVLHRHFEHLVETYHPFATYLGFSEIAEGFVLGYDGGNGTKYMIVDCEFDVIADETFGTSRSLSFGAIALEFLSAVLGGDQH